jgi:hypothetical protein
MIYEHSSNLALGVIAGAVAALIGAAIWAAITVATGYQIGWMAVGVGFLVGIAVRQFGRGTTPVYGTVGAALALAGCVLGNVFAMVGYYANQENLPFFSVLAQAHPVGVMNALIETASPIDLLFYGIAVYEGFKLSVVPGAAEPATTQPNQLP